MDAQPDGENPNRAILSVLLPMIKEIVTFLSVGGMVVGGVVPYIPQYRKIRKTRDVAGFSGYVCLVLLIANILRVFFWFGVHYEAPLLAQSLIMIACMLGMMHLCVTVSNEGVSSVVHQSFLDWRYFWKWTNYWHYLLFTALFTLIGGTITLLLLSVHVYIQLLGFASLLTEAMLGIPQFWKNLKNKSTEGMSVQMVLFWTSGDTFKTIYFIVRESPLQFWVCGLLQVTVDISILLQVAVYRRRRQRVTSTNVFGGL